MKIHDVICDVCNTKTDRTEYQVLTFSMPEFWRGSAKAASDVPLDVCGKCMKEVRTALRLRDKWTNE